MTYAIRYHHKPSDLKEKVSDEVYQLLGIVHLADALCMMLGHGMGNDGLLYAVDLDYLNAHGFNIDAYTLQELMLHLHACQGEVKTLNDSIK
jgi:hypothetical protein